MDLKFIKVDRNFKDAEILDQVKQEAFPDIESITSDMVIKASDQNYGTCIACYDNDDFIGFLFYISIDDLVYIILFAVNQNFRNKGYGGKILQTFMDKQLSSNPNSKFALDVEYPHLTSKNHEQRIKRIAFYEKLGFHLTNIIMDFHDEDFIIMTTADKVNKDNCIKLGHKIYDMEAKFKNN